MKPFQKVVAEAGVLNALFIVVKKGKKTENESGLFGKAELRRAGNSFSLHFPAKLRVITDGSRYEFNTPAEGAAFFKDRQPAG